MNCLGINPHAAFGVMSAFAVLLSLAGSGCRGGAAAKSGRREPICAVQDCATGKIIDNGCADDGRCLSCVSTCGEPVTPSGPAQ